MSGTLFGPAAASKRSPRKAKAASLPGPPAEEAPPVPRVATGYVVQADLFGYFHLRQGGQDHWLPLSGICDVFATADEAGARLVELTDRERVKAAVVPVYGPVPASQRGDHPWGPESPVPEPPPADDAPGPASMPDDSPG